MNPRRAAYIFGGAFGLVTGILLAVWGDEGDARLTTRMLVFGSVVGVIGLTALVQGLTGNLPEDR